MAAKQVLGAETSTKGPISVTMLPPCAGASLGPSVKSQTLPSTSVARDNGPAAASASASAGKFSTCQYSGPAGNSATVFSAIGSTTNFSCSSCAVGVAVWVVGSLVFTLLVHPDSARAPVAAHTAAMRQIFPRPS
jgi:hypothetical protein